jgi:t-SNARE complex subunit (syntaxin)
MTTVLREIPSVKKRVKPMLRWLRHIQDVYNEINTEFLKRPEVIEAFNRLYDEVERYEHAYIMEFPSKQYHYFAGIIPYYNVIQNYRRTAFSQNNTYVFRTMYRGVIDGQLIPYAGMLRYHRTRHEIEYLLGRNNILGTDYANDNEMIDKNLTLLYVQLYELVRSELEPVLIKKLDEIVAKYQLVTLKKNIDKKNAQRERLEKNYQRQIKTIENDLDAMYKQLQTLDSKIVDK